MRSHSIFSGFALIAVVTLSGCGSGSGSNSNVGSVPGSINGNNTINNQNGTIPTGQCVPINQQISFVGQGIYRDSANIVGGRLPMNGQTVGAMGVTQGYYGGGYGYGNNNYQWQMTGEAYGRAGSDGTMYMTTTNQNQFYPGQGYPYQGYPYNSQYNANPYANNQTNGNMYYGSYPNQWQTQNINVQGTLMVSQLVIQDILRRFQTGAQPQVSNGYPNYYGGGYQFWNPYQQNQNVPCASGIAMNVGHYHQTVYGGQVFLYLNNTDHGYALYF